MGSTKVLLGCHRTKLSIPLRKSDSSDNKRKGGETITQTKQKRPTIRTATVPTLYKHSEQTYLQIYTHIQIYTETQTQKKHTHICSKTRTHPYTERRKSTQTHSVLHLPLLLVTRFLHPRLSFGYLLQLLVPRPIPVSQTGLHILCPGPSFSSRSLH